MSCGDEACDLNTLSNWASLVAHMVKNLPVFTPCNNPRRQILCPPILWKKNLRSQSLLGRQGQHCNPSFPNLKHMFWKKSHCFSYKIDLNKLVHIKCPTSVCAHSGYLSTVRAFLYLFGEWIINRNC